MPSIAAKYAITPDRHVPFSSLPANFVEKGFARVNVEPRKPNKQAGRNQAGKFSCWPKSTMCSEPPGARRVSGRADGVFPVGDHRQRIGNEDRGRSPCRGRTAPAAIESRRRRPARRRHPAARRLAARFRRGRPAFRRRCRGRKAARPASARAAANRLRPVPQPISSTRAAPGHVQPLDQAVAAEAGSICGSGRRRGAGSGRSGPSAPHGRSWPPSVRPFP